ncbi:MAG: AmmeMemoRadiSam system protein A, partial [Chitinispirillaceae bacterium]|nr:AmmeMemoRadiSam system protein A [Chitinispirillaceae bacterium]
SKLREMVKKFIGEGVPLDVPVHVLISPHAGYIFSGPVAGKGYATIDKKAKRVFIIGPSHYEAFNGIALPSFQYYETPLGKVKIDIETVNKLKNQKDVIIAEGFDEPEHCLEVQLPFLQVLLENFSIIPIITGKVDPEYVADLLIPYLDGNTLIIASSDLSHYLKQEKARKIDDASIEAIISGNLNKPIDACGEIAIKVVMSIAKKKGLKAIKLDARTSFETAPQYSPPERVVGYAAIAFVPSDHKKDNNKQEAENKKKENSETHLTEEAKKFLLKIARESLEAAVNGKKYTPPEPTLPKLKENSGCFVTLTKNGELRGCIGYIEPIKPLYIAVAENALNAALRDYRFPQVTPEELKSIKIEISVLTKPVPLPYKDEQDLLNKLVPGRDGVILSKDGHQSTYLPQVWEQLPDKRLFLEQLSLKGGMPKDGWKTAEVKTYQVIHFNE